MYFDLRDKVEFFEFFKAVSRSSVEEEDGRDIL